MQLVFWQLNAFDVTKLQLQEMLGLHQKAISYCSCETGVIGNISVFSS